MTTTAQLEANRRNAKSSTGPRTAAGKASASRGALKHGLNAPIVADPDMPAAIGALARRILGNGSDPVLLPLAHAVAEAQFELARVRRARHALLSRAFDDPDYDSRRNWREKLNIFRFTWRLVEEDRVPRMPSGVRLLWNSLPSDSQETPQQACERFARRLVDAGVKQWEPIERYAIALSDMADKLAILDRYERRALSRRNTAIRDLDAAREGPSKAGHEIARAVVDDAI